MFRLAAMIYVLTATALAGVAVTALLTMKMVVGWQLASAAGAGAVVAIPIAWLIARQIYSNIGRRA